MIAIIDYGMGNLKSVSKAFEKVGATVCVTRDKQVIAGAHKIVLPGVGAFPQCMANLKNYGLDSVVVDEVRKGKWFLGICLGLQLLFDESDEFGPVAGLGLVRGRVQRFEFDTPSELKIPHMGWNQVHQQGSQPLFKNIPQEAFFYFVHSYYVVPQKTSAIAATTQYGLDFCSCLVQDNIMATQFHPEKSQQVGLQLLKNFTELS